MKSIWRLFLILAIVVFLSATGASEISAAESFSELIDFQEHIIDVENGYGRAISVDFDSDGDTDIIRFRLNVDLGEYYWYENDGFQNFGRHTLTLNGTPPGATNDFRVEDVDRDGDYDLVAIDIYMGQMGQNSLLHWYENNGTNITFNEHVLEEVVGSDYYYSSLQAIDFDNDGDTDIAASVMYVYGVEDTYESLLIFFNDGNQNFTRQPLILSSDLRMVYNFSISDIDGDGDNDAVIAGSTLVSALFTTRWYENNGILPLVPHIIEAAERLLSLSARVADINNDGYLDIVVDHGTSLVWYEGSSTYDFSIAHLIDEFQILKPAQINSDSSGSKISISDINNDGNLDIAFSASYQEVPRLYMYLNEGSGIFGQRQIVDSGDFVWYIFPDIGDIDNDGFGDIVAAGDNKLSWFENLSEPQTIDLYGQNLAGVKVGANQLEVNLDVLNGGNSSAQEFKVAFFAIGKSTENIGSSEINNIRKRIGEIIIPSLDAGQAYNISQNFFVKNLDLYQGLGTVIDIDNQITESDETNNSLKVKIRGN